MWPPAHRRERRGGGHALDRQLVLRVVASHPVAFMVAGFALVMAVSLRSVLVAPAIASISLAPGHRHRAAARVRPSFHQAQMGSTASAPRRWPCSAGCRC